MSMNALDDMINEESENQVKDTFQNIGNVGQDLQLLTKSLHFPPKYLQFFFNNPPISFRIQDFICTSMNALEDMINEESENQVKDTFHNAVNIGDVGQDLQLLTKSLHFPPKYLRFFFNKPPIILRKVNFLASESQKIDE